MIPDALHMMLTTQYLKSHMLYARDSYQCIYIYIYIYIEWRIYQGGILLIAFGLPIDCLLWKFCCICCIVIECLPGLERSENCWGQIVRGYALGRNKEEQTTKPKHTKQSLRQHLPKRSPKRLKEAQKYHTKSRKVRRNPKYSTRVATNVKD